VAHLQKGSRSVFQPETGSFADTPVYDGDGLRHGNRLEGPAIVEKVTTTIFVPAGFALAVDSFGGCVLEDRVTETLA
jgi:N-methylhydantoinase A